MADEKITLDPNADLSVLKEPIEIDLIKKLNDYTELIDTAALERAPIRLPTIPTNWQECSIPSTTSAGYWASTLPSSRLDWH